MSSLGPRRRAPWLLLAGPAALPAVASAKPDAPARTESATLVPAELSDFDLVPPELTVSLADLASGSLAPPPKNLTIRPTGLVVDWDGDGRVDATVRSGKTGVV